MHIRSVNWRRWLAGIACSLFLLVSPAQADRILAVVGDEVITESDLNRVVKAWAYQLKGQFSDLEYVEKLQEMKKEALNRLIEESLLYLRAKDEGITIAPEMVQREIAKIKERFPSEEDFLSSLRESGMTLQDLYDQIERKLMIQKLISKEVKSRVYINPVEVAKTFKKERSRFCSVTRVKVDSVFVPFPSGGESKGEEMEFDTKVMEEYVNLKEGVITWRDLKDKYGQGPIVGWKGVDDLSPQISKTLFDPNSGVYPMPVKVSTGYMFFRVEERELDCPKDLEEAKEKVYQYLFAKKMRKLLKEYIQDLKKEYYVKIYQ